MQLQFDEGSRMGRRLLLILAVALALVPGEASADPFVEGDDVVLPGAWLGCGLQEVDALGSAICSDGQPEPAAMEPGARSASLALAAEEDGLPASCRLRNEVIFWTDTNWLRVARNLAANPAPCTEYYISIPPVATPKHQLRRFQAAQIRAFGPQFHALADIHLGETGWVSWVAENRSRFSSDEETWYEAGVEARRRMARADVNFDIESGDSWLLNDFNTGTRRNGGTYVGLDLEQWNRKNMRALIRGLHEGPADGSLGQTRGIAQVAIQFTHQNIPFIDEYKADWKNWLQDDAFWTDVRKHVRWIGKEVYADSRYWGTPDTSRNARSRHLQQFLFHPLELVEAGPDSVSTAREYFRDAYLPLANATWAALGPDRFDPLFCCGHGETMLPIDRMLTYVTEEMFAIRQYANSHPQSAPAGRLGFTWQPTNNFMVSNEEFLAAQDAILQRIASALRWGYRQGGASPAGICGPPESGENWCNGGRDGATFTEQWETFSRWD